jgi:hypothetical protein
MQTQTPLVLTLTILLVVAVVLLALASRRRGARRGGAGDAAGTTWMGGPGSHCAAGDGGCGDGGGD